jgi:hypothetical protein
MFFRRKILDWRAMRSRIIRETNDYITECLRNPDMAVFIPRMPAHKARWSREFAEAFWNGVL